MVEYRHIALIGGVGGTFAATSWAIDKSVVLAIIIFLVMIMMTFYGFIYAAAMDVADWAVENGAIFRSGDPPAPTGGTVVDTAEPFSSRHTQDQDWRPKSR